MKASKTLALPVAFAVFCGFAIVAQEGPKREGSESVAKPRRKAGEQPAEAEGAKIPSKYGKKKEGDIPESSASFKSDVATVQLDIAVLDNKGRFIPNIPRDKFRVLEDGVPQQVSNFNLGEAPMTVAMVIEFSNRWQSYWTETWYQTLTAAYGFVETLKPEDYVAVIAYDMRSEILSDFTTDKRQVYDAMRRLQIAAYSESNLFDAVTDTAQRMEEIEGRKAIVLISSGDDTFSKLTFDKTRKILQNAGVPIYAIGIGRLIREYMDAMGAGAIFRLDGLQAENQLRTFSKETGGQAFLPRFEGELGGIFRAIADALRNQYSLAYSSSNQARDGKFRKIKVELVNPATGEALKIVDEKGKPIKYTVLARNGYTAPREVE